MHRKALFVLILLVTSLGSVHTAVALPDQPSQDQPSAQPSPPPDRRAAVVRAFLRLNDDQFESFLRLLRARAETIDPLRRAWAEQTRELGRLLRAPDPDPIAVGSVVLTIRSTRQQIADAEDTFRSGFMDILTEEQRRRLAGLERFIENRLAAPAFLSLGLIDVGFGPEPRRTIMKALGLDLR